MADIQTFLADLALDASKFAEFLRNPDAAMDRARLSTDDKEALKSGIPAMILARLAAYLAYPPPYYTPVSLSQLPTHPTFVTMAPYPLPTFVTKVPYLFVTATPVLYVKPGDPLYVTLPPLPQPESPADPAPSKTDKKRK